MLFPTPRQMKTIEENSDRGGISYRALMENAGSALARFIVKTIRKHRLYREVVFLCGSGNNGGDGFVAARLLASDGLYVTVILLGGEPKTEPAAAEYRELLASEGVEIISGSDEKVMEKILTASVIVDAVFGTGFHGDLPMHIKKCFDFADKCRGVKIAVDVPSGGDCLRGTISKGALKCLYTMTFGYKKIGMLMYPLAEYCGEIIIADIGFTDECTRGADHIPRLFDETDVLTAIPKRKRDSHKGDLGKLLNISGCAAMSGAAALSTKAALRCGAGLVTLASVENVIDRISGSIPEATYLPLTADENGSAAGLNAEQIMDSIKNKTAVSIGSGLSVTAGTKLIVKKVIKEAACPIILDADGINCILDNIDIIRDAKNKLIITPHIGELARITKSSAAEAAAERLSLAANIAWEYGVIVVAKGVPTIIAGEGKVYVIPAGNPGLSRGGSGDVLTGIIASLCAQGIEPIEAAAAGVYIHGAAADIAADKLSEAGMLPSDVIESLPFVFKKLNR